MSIGCIICSEVFSSTDPAESHPVSIRSCGHSFHASCLSTWLAKSKSCPVCRCSTLDSPSYINRLHLQSVNNLNVSGFYLNPSTSPGGSRKEIEELRKKLADANATIEKLRGYIVEAKKSLDHAEIELGSTSTVKKQEPVIDLSQTYSDSPGLRVEARAVRAAPVSSAASRAPTRIQQTREPRLVMNSSEIRGFSSGLRSRSKLNLSPVQFTVSQSNSYFPIVQDRLNTSSSSASRMASRRAAAVAKK